MGVINLQLDGVEGISRMQRFVSPKSTKPIRAAMKYGLQYASRAGKTESAKQIRAKYSIASARIKKDIDGPFLSPDFSEAKIIFARKPPSALAYGGRDTGKGLRMTVIKGQRKRVARGFLVRSGRLAGKPFRRIGPERKPIDFVSGPSIGSIFAGESRFGEQIRTEVGKRINEQFAKGFERKLSEKARRS